MVNSPARNANASVAGGPAPSSGATPTPTTPPTAKQRATSLYLMVRSRQQLVFQGQIKALSAVDDRGLFDVLPEHINFISLVRDLLVIHSVDGKQQELKIGQGVLKVFDNKVFVYLIS